jgi:hypothetical protein
MNCLPSSFVFLQLSISRNTDVPSCEHLIAESTLSFVRVPFEKFVDWWQCAAVMQREAVTVNASCSGESNVVVA